MQEVINDVVGRLNTVSYSADAVKLSVPPPSAQMPTGPVAAGSPLYYQLLGVGTASAATAAGRSENELYQTAISAMRNNYDPVYRPAGQGIPTFVAVDQPGSNQPNPGTSGPTNSGSGNSTAGPGASVSGNGPQKSDQSQSQQTTPSSDDSSSQPAGAGDQGLGNSSGASQSTVPSGLNSSTSPAGFGGGGGGLGSGGGFGGLGSAGGAGEGNSGGLGRSMPGARPANPAAAAAAASMGKPGAAGMGGMPGMGGAGAKKGEQKDGEHKTPGYLVMDREEELIGHIDPMALGAIGANIPAAQTYRDNNEGGRR